MCFPNESGMLFRQQNTVLVVRCRHAVEENQIGKQSTRLETGIQQIHH